MTIELDEKMRDFIVRHFEKRIAVRKQYMPLVELDPWLGFADKKEVAEHLQSLREAKKKTLDFIHNSTLVIELLKQK